MPPLYSTGAVLNAFAPPFTPPSEVSKAQSPNRGGSRKAPRDRNELLSGMRLQIRHISEGPPPKMSVERPLMAVGTSLACAKRPENASCVFVVRGVNRLGEEAGFLIKSFFSQWGCVASLRFACPARPGMEARDFSPSLAFVVMSSASEVSCILQQDGYMIAGRRVQVEEYVRLNDSANDAFDEMADSLLKNLDLY